jgi:lysine-N-methylase
MSADRFHAVQTPDYVRQFQCLGSECPQTCCSGWQVDIDKSNYKKIQKAEVSPALKGKIQRHFKLNPQPTASTYGVIELDTNKACPMLTDNHLCGIQAELDESHLSATCRYYPRKLYQVGNQIEMYLTLSCPEAARLCLTQDQPWGLSEYVTHTPKGKPLPVIRPSQRMGNAFEQAYIQNRALIRQFMVDVVGQLSAPVWHRVLLTGLTLQKLHQLSEDALTNDPAAIEKVLLSSQLDLLTGAFSSEVDANLTLEKTESVQKRFVQDMTDLRIAMVPPEIKHLFNPSFRELVIKGFDQLNRLNSEQGASAGEAARAALAEFEQQHPRFFSNYLTNAFSASSFSVGSGASLMQDWMHIAIRFALLRFYIKGLACQPNGLSLEEAVRMTYGFAKVIEHSTAYAKGIEALMARQGIDGVVGAAILLS